MASQGGSMNLYAIHWYDEHQEREVATGYCFGETTDDAAERAIDEAFDVVVATEDDDPERATPYVQPLDKEQVQKIYDDLVDSVEKDKDALDLLIIRMMDLEQVLEEMSK